MIVLAVHNQHFEWVGGVNRQITEENCEDEECLAHRAVLVETGPCCKEQLSSFKGVLGGESSYVALGADVPRIGDGINLPKIGGNGSDSICL